MFNKVYYKLFTKTTREEATHASHIRKIRRESDLKKRNKYIDSHYGKYKKKYVDRPRACCN